MRLCKITRLAFTSLSRMLRGWYIMYTSFLHATLFHELNSTVSRRLKSIFFLLWKCRGRDLATAKNSWRVSEPYTKWVQSTVCEIVFEKQILRRSPLITVAIIFDGRNPALKVDILWKLLIILIFDVWLAVGLLCHPIIYGFPWSDNHGQSYKTKNTTVSLTP